MTFWLLFFSYFPIAMILTFFSFRKIKREYLHRESIGYEFFPSDIHWHSNRLFDFPIFSFISGLLAGVLGIGGGLILGPLLLKLGLNPIVIFMV